MPVLHGDQAYHGVPDPDPRGPIRPVLQRDRLCRAVTPLSIFFVALLPFMNESLEAQTMRAAETASEMTDRG